MERRQGWLFPLMVAAASTVTVFSCLGIAAIMGVLPLSLASDSQPARPTATSYYDALEQSSARLVAQVDMVEAQTAKAAAATAQPGRGGR
jgi:hypothetical protein